MTYRARPGIGSDLTVETDSLLAPLRATKQAALTYLHAGDSLFVWMLTPDGTVTLTRTPLAASELAMLIRSARRTFGTDDARSAELAPDDFKATSKADSVALASRNAADDLRRLAALLLPDDLDSRVLAGTPIVIVPHGAIGLVSFAALERKRSDSTTTCTTRPTKPSRAVVTAAATESATLGLRNPLRFAPSFAALRATEARTVVLAPRSATSTTMRHRQLATALVGGNPTMPMIYSGRWTTRAQLRSLPGAAAEGRRIATQLGASILTGRAATETVIRARLTTAPIVHFATHGMAYGTSSASRRSYVAFAPDKTNDGLLTLGELMDDATLVLHTELVVLSACQTGLGDFKQADGTIGLQRAFLAKGAVCWSVCGTWTMPPRDC